MSEQPNLTELKPEPRQIAEYAALLLEDRGLIETLVLVAGAAHDQAVELNNEDLMKDSDDLFEFAHQLRTMNSCSAESGEESTHG